MEYLLVSQVSKTKKMKFIVKYLLKFCLLLHTYLYKIITILSIKHEDGIHPKHDLLKYKEWFLNILNKNDVVLDIGSNTGNMPLLFSKKCKKVYGIEIEKIHHETAVKRTKNIKNIKLFNSDATKFNYKSIEKISVVTLSNVLEHIEDRVSFIKSIIENVRWKTKPTLLIRVPMIDREWTVLYKKKLGIEYRLDSTHFIEYTESSFRSEIKKNNLLIKSLNIRFGEIYAICEKK